MVTGLPLNQLLADMSVEPARRVYYTVQRDPEAPKGRRKPFQLCRVETVTVPPPLYSYSPAKERSYKAFEAGKLGFAALSEDEALAIIAGWKLQPEPIEPHNEPAFNLILAEANRLGLPKNYREDLTRIDRSILLCPGAPREFIWILRSNGTHLFGLDRERIQQSRGDRPSDLVSAMMRSGDDEMHWYHFAGKLREITADKAMEIARDAEAGAH